MNRIHLITALMLFLFSFSLRAEDDKVRFAYDVDFEMRFDNREYYRSAFSPSMTIFGASPVSKLLSVVTSTVTDCISAILSIGCTMTAVRVPYI